MLIVILYGIAIVCLAAASQTVAPANRWLVGIAILLAVVGMITAATGSRVTIGTGGDHRRLPHASEPA